MLPGKVEFKLPWREAGPSNHLDDEVDSDQQVVNREFSLYLLKNIAEQHERLASQQSQPPECPVLNLRGS